MKLILISGSGIGSGKTTFAHKVAGTVLSLADTLREEVSALYPTVDFWDRSQTNKARIVGENGETVRDLMIMVGQQRRQKDPDYWVMKLIDKIQNDIFSGKTIAIDDIRYINEITCIHRFLSYVKITHAHIQYFNAIGEPETDNNHLYDEADYIISRKD